MNWHPKGSKANMTQSKTQALGMTVNTSSGQKTIIDAVDALTGGDEDVNGHKVASGSKRKRESDEGHDIQ